MITPNPSSAVRDVAALQLASRATPKTCNRCRQIAPRRGRMSAAITLQSGRTVRRYLCRLCIRELQSGAMAQEARQAA
jgi:O-acetyl-ADP-ribose deacetylase (regulator of RNase III)